MRICLIGSTGFLGKKVAEELDIHNIDWVGTTLTQPNKPNIIKIKKNNKTELVRILEECDIVINASGSLKPRDFELYPEKSLKEFWENINFFSSVFIESKIKTIVNFSSGGTVYGENNTQLDFCENDYMNPISWYGRSKMLEELHYNYLCNMNNINLTNCRITNPFGKDGPSNHGFVDVLINCIKTGKTFKLYEKLTPTRDFVSSVDMAKMIVGLVVNKVYGTYNIGSGRSYSLNDILKFIPGFSEGEDFKIEFDGVKPSYEVLNSRVSVDKIKSIGLFSEQLSLEDYIVNSLRN